MSHAGQVPRSLKMLQTSHTHQSPREQILFQQVWAGAQFCLLACSSGMPRLLIQEPHCRTNISACRGLHISLGTKTRLGVADEVLRGPAATYPNSLIFFPRFVLLFARLWPWPPLSTSSSRRSPSQGLGACCPAHLECSFHACSPGQNLLLLQISAQTSLLQDNPLTAPTRVILFTIHSHGKQHFHLQFGNEQLMSVSPPGQASCLVSSTSVFLALSTWFLSFVPRFPFSWK